MEESLNGLREAFGLTDIDPDSCPALTLAYIGDAVYEVIVRYIVISRHKQSVGKLHTLSSRIVCAEAQSETVSAIEPLLTERELAVYRRGRNAKSHTAAKNASITEYRRATGFEALIGYLFLKGEYERMLELCEMGIGR